MSIANVNNNLVITAAVRSRGFFGSKPGKEPQARNFSLCLWIIRSPPLLQPGLSRYTKVLARKCAHESS